MLKLDHAEKPRYLYLRWKLWLCWHL